MLRRQQAAGKRLEGEERKAALPEMEEVVAWIEGCRAKNFRVTRAFCRRPRIIAASFSRRKKISSCDVCSRKYGMCGGTLSGKLACA